MDVSVVFSAASKQSAAAAKARMQYAISLCWQRGAVLSESNVRLGHAGAGFNGDSFIGMEGKLRVNENADRQTPEVLPLVPV